MEIAEYVYSVVAWEAAEYIYSARMESVKLLAVYTIYNLYMSLQI
jgi:hypothetical protein